VANGFHRTLASGARSLTDDQRSLYMGLIVGDDRDQPPLSQHQFRASGLAHLSAVSGQNLVFVFAVLHPLSSRLSLRTRWILLGFATVLFVLVTRAEPSVLRAATMAAFALGASLAGRRATGIRLLSLCVLALLLADPLLVHSVGFQLSLGATAGLILLSHPLACAIPAPQWLALPIAVTLAAQAGALLPLTANFGVVSIVSVPANLLAEPAAAGVMTMGLTGGFLAGLVRHPFDAALQFPVGLLVSWIDGVAATASRIAVPPLGLVGWVAIAVSVFIAWVLWRRRGIDSIGRCVGVIAAAGVVLLRPSAPGEHLPVAGGVAGIDSCGGSILVLEKGDGVPAVEDLWKLGIFRVDTVVGDGFPVDGTVAEQLRARRVIQAESSQLRTDALCSFGA
jgi:competence protein ComEC